MRARRSSQAAARFYPRQPATIVAVTGTSGKTSVAAFARQIWTRLGREAASLGTLGVVSRPITVYGSLTTPDPVALHQSLDRLAGAGVTHLAMEASSHGLDQKRLDGVRLAAGAFTNLSRDHLDYHATPEDYLAAKLRLFARTAAAAARRPSSTPTAKSPPTSSTPRAAARPRAVHRRRRGEAIRLVARRPRGFRDPARTRPRGRALARAAAAARRFPGLQRAGRGGALPRDGERPGRRLRRAGDARRRAGPPGARRREGAARRSSSTTPTSPTRWKRRWRRCALSCAAA